MATAKKTETTTTENIKDTVKENVNGAREVATDVTKALSESGKAYVSGLMELGRAFGNIGREVLTETRDYAQAVVKSKSLREVAERQAAFVQHRVEMSATHTKELVDLTREKTEEVINPVTDLLSASKKAA